MQDIYEFVNFILETMMTIYLDSLDTYMQYAIYAAGGSLQNNLKVRPS